MIVTTVFIYIIVFQLLFFHLISFPLLAIQSEKQRAELKLDAILAKMDVPIIPCNVTGVNCGACKNVTDDGGMIESPHFPEPYASNLNCLFTINAPYEMKIKLTFTEFKVDDCCDFITVFDESANLIQSSLNGSETPTTVTSPSNQMTIKFTSHVNNTTRLDPPGPATRWQATYTFM
ncbi:blastula protease 10-like [Daphnia carinata]|uniref:blastula protease 10-like n=1 Tax=Daphnia carinata TaxID=120202 RepID=UPI002868D458|nr:blastula protease 10-like [Daphnia carinata]